MTTFFEGLTFNREIYETTPKCSGIFYDEISGSCCLITAFLKGLGYTIGGDEHKEFPLTIVSHPQTKKVSYMGGILQQIDDFMESPGFTDKIITSYDAHLDKEAYSLMEQLVEKIKNE